MNRKTNWSEIIVYHDILYKNNAVFWMPSNKIYIYYLVKKYDVFHEYILDHEKKHYLTFNCDNNIVIKIILDICNEWSGAWINTTNKELKNNKIQYMKELSEIKKNKIMIKNIHIFMEKLCEIKPTRKIWLYSKIVEYLRPDSKILILLIILLILVEILWILKII